MSSSISSLRKSLIPPNPQTLSPDEKCTILDAISTLSDLALQTIQFTKHHKQRPLKPIDATKLWKSGILAWFEFLFEYYDPPVDSTLPDRWTVISYVSCVFTYFIQVDRELVSETPGTGTFAIRLWLVTDYDYQRSAYALGNGWWDPALELLARLGMQPHHRKEIFEVEGVRRRSMIHLTLKRLDETTTVHHDDYDERQQYLRLITFLVQFNILEPSEKVPTIRIAHVLSKKLAYLVGNLCPHEPFPSSLMFTCLMYFDEIQKVLFYAQSIEAVATSIRAGLLRAFVNYSPILTKWKSGTQTGSPIPKNISGPQVESAIQLIAKTIPRFMVFSSVLSAIEEELECIDDEHMGDTIVGLRWDKFLRLYECNKEFLDNFTDVPRIAYCDNLKHDITDNSGTIHVCSGCQKAKYCSQKCQREDWTSGHHRTECRGSFSNPACMKVDTSQSPSDKDNIKLHNLLSKRDQLSVCRFAIMTARLQWEQLQQRAEREHPSLSITQLSIFFDFTRHPHEIRLHPREVDNVAMAAGRYVRNSVVVQCFVTLGLYKVLVRAVGDVDFLQGLDSDSDLGKSRWWVTRAPQLVSKTIPRSEVGRLGSGARVFVDKFE